MDKRWGISIDIEGFSSLYECGEKGKTRAIWGLHELMKAIIHIGTHAYPGDPAKNDSDPIFSHQFGDGFIIVSNFEEPDPCRCIAISVSLMRHMTMKGYSTKAAISTGDMTDIQGCYPEEVRLSNNGSVSLGAGLLTTIPAMGTALTKAHKLSSRVSGNVLVIDRQAYESIPETIISSSEANWFFIDWRLDEHELARTISEKSGLNYGSQDQLHRVFDEYILKEPIPPKSWVEGSKRSVKSST